MARRPSTGPLGARRKAGNVKQASFGSAYSWPKTHADHASTKCWGVFSAAKLGRCGDRTRFGLSIAAGPPSKLPAVLAALPDSSAGAIIGVEDIAAALKDAWLVVESVPGANTEHPIAGRLTSVGTLVARVNVRPGAIEIELVDDAADTNRCTLVQAADPRAA